MRTIKAVMMPHIFKKKLYFLGGTENESKKDIPILPDFNVSTAATKLLVSNMDPFYNNKVCEHNSQK